MLRTHDQFAHLISPGMCGSSEMMRVSSHVPVFSTYRVNGVDQSLLRRWQVITGVRWLCVAAGVVAAAATRKGLRHRR